jgi:hypothetical protein
VSGTFVVTSGGQVTHQPESRPEPTDKDRRRAALLAEGGGFAPDAEDLFARGIAVARKGGDVRAFLRDELGKDRRP